jgi:hypothetical protein
MYAFTQPLTLLLASLAWLLHGAWYLLRQADV